MLREKAQSVTTARPKVPMRRLGAHCLVVAMKRGNARGAKGVGHQRWIGSTGVGSTGSGRNLIINGRRQPSHGGTSRMMREYHVRICEGLGVQLPGSTRQGTTEILWYRGSCPGSLLAARAARRPRLGTRLGKKSSRPTKYPVPQRGCSATLSTTAEDHIATRRAPDRSSAFPFPFSGSSAASS